MAYLLDKTVFLEDFIEGDDSVMFRARANVDEVNNVLSRVYACEPELLEREMNFHHYNFGNVEVRYWTNGTLSARLKSEPEYLERIKSHVVKIRGI